MQVISLCATLRVAPCVSDSGCEYTYSHTLASSEELHHRMGIAVQGMGCALTFTTQRYPQEVLCRGLGREGQKGVVCGD